MDGSVDFERLWADYKAGFGDREGEFWLGLDKLHLITNSAWSYSLSVDMTAFNGDQFWAEYSHFSVGPESDNYRLTVSGYNPASTAGDSMTNTVRFGNHTNLQFTTTDEDNDLWTSNCAVRYTGGWWHNDCHYAFPTGRYSDSPGVSWYTAYNGQWVRFQTMTYTLVPV